MRNILLVGVGGQGTILAAKLLSIGLMEAGFDVKMSEIHGMSQRGGSVSSHIRYGERVWSPVIEKGGADLLISFELMEALRWLEYLRPGGRALVNDRRIMPMPVLGGLAEYPENIAETLRARAGARIVAADLEAEKLGSPRAMNILLLGAAIKSMDLPPIDWRRIVSDNVKAAFMELNLKALARGMELA